MSWPLVSCQSQDPLEAEGPVGRGAGPRCLRQHVLWFATSWIGEERRELLIRQMDTCDAGGPGGEPAHFDGQIDPLIRGWVLEVMTRLVAHVEPPVTCASRAVVNRRDAAVVNVDAEILVGRSCLAPGTTVVDEGAEVSATVEN